MGGLDIQISVRRTESGVIICEVELSKDGPIGRAFTSKLKPVELGRDPDGDPITSCVVEPVEGAAAMPAERPTKLPKSAQIALRALHEALGASRGRTCDFIPPRPRFLCGVGSSWAIDELVTMRDGANSNGATKSISMGTRCRKDYPILASSYGHHA